MKVQPSLSKPDHVVADTDSYPKHDCTLTGEHRYTFVVPDRALRTDDVVSVVHSTVNRDGSCSAAGRVDVHFGALVELFAMAKRRAQEEPVALTRDWEVVFGPDA